MRRLTALLCLMLSLVGTPLRLAEAADDFARSLAELADAVRIEQVDGGVGDEAELATLKAAEPLAESSPASIVPWGEPHFAAPLDSFRPAPTSSGSPPGGMHWRAATAGRWHAWFQVFLF